MQPADFVFHETGSLIILPFSYCSVKRYLFESVMVKKINWTVGTIGPGSSSYPGL